MKIWKIILTAILGVLAIVLAYPGIPVSSSQEINSSTRYAMLTCSYLHWTGLRVREIDMRDAFKNGGISMNNEPCYSWSNWNPMNSS